MFELVEAFHLQRMLAALIVCLFDYIRGRECTVWPMASKP